MNEKKRIDLEEVNNNQSDTFYNDFDAKEKIVNYEQTEHDRKDSFLESHSVVTDKSKSSKRLLYGFYILLILIVLIVFIMMRSNKYEFYLKNNEVSVNTGSTYQVELIPKNARYFDYTNYNYSIKDENIATVDEFGKVTAIAPGRTTLKISLSPGITSKSMTIISEDINIENIDLKMYRDDNIVDGSIIEMNTNQSIKLKAIGNGREGLNLNVNYSSSNSNVVSVDEFGNVVANKVGTAVIEGERNGVKGSITINVNEGSSSSVKPDPKTDSVIKTPVPEQKKVIVSITNTEMYVGNTLSLSASLSPNSGSDNNITWSSSKTSVVTVDNNGKVTAVGTGTAIVTAIIDGVKGTCTIIVRNKPTITPTPNVTSSPTINPTQTVDTPKIPASTFNSKYIKVSANKIDLSQGESKSFTIKVYNAVGMFNLKTKAALMSDNVIHIDIDKTKTAPLDGLSADGVAEWKEAKITVTGKSKGYTYIVIEPNSDGGVYTYDTLEALTGSHTVLVHVS